MLRTMALLALLALTTTTLADPPPGQSGADYVEPVKLDEILLTDGNLLIGRIIEEHEDYVIFETDTLGRMEILRTNIERIARSGDRAGVMVDPDYNSLMFCPTPATLAKGDSYFRDFELFFLNFGTGVTDAFDLSFGTLFPISSDVIMVSVGGKFRLIDREEKPVGLALVGSYTKMEDVSFSAVGAVAGVGNKRSSFNVLINRTSDDDGDSETVYIIGGDTQLTRRSKIFGEFMSSSALFADDSDIEGFINIGVRMFGDSHSFSLSGFRPLDTNSDSFIAFPMIMYSNHW